MVASQDVLDQLQQTLAAAARCSTHESVESYEFLNQELQELESTARRSWESHIDCKALLGKLRAGDPLDSEEMAKLRLLVIGDADSYLKYDKEFERCKDDLGKIMAEVERMQANELDRDVLMRLSVLCREACAMLRPTERYLEQRDRVRSFESASQGTIDRDTGRALANIVDDILSH